MRTIETQRFEAVGTGNWAILVPRDWSVSEESALGVLHLESEDGAKALSVSTWNLGDGASRAPEDLIETFRLAELDSLREMRGYRWRRMAEDVRQLAGVSILVTDNWDKANGYRIAGKVMALPPLVVRATFHDYACVDYAASARYFSPIIDSLEFRLETPS